MGILRTWPGSVVCTDLRRELHRHTAQDREAFGPVYAFDPANATSCHLNVLDMCRWGTDAAWGDLHRVCHHLVLPKRARDADQFSESAVELLTGIAAYCREQGHGHFAGVRTWMRAPGVDRKDKLKAMLQSPTPQVQEAAQGFLDQSPNFQAVIWEKAVAPLTVFADATIAAHTSTTDFAWHDLLNGVEPVTLFLCMDFGDIDRLGPFMGALTEALTAMLGTPPVTPDHKVLLLLDECANLGTLTALEKGVSFLQGAGTQVFLAFQNLAQVLQLYGPDSPLLASIGTLVHYCPSPGDEATALWISRQLGEGTVWAQTVGEGTSASHTTSTGVGLSLSGLSGQMAWSDSSGQNTAYTQTQTQRSLLLPDEVRRIGEETALVLTKGVAPVWASKFPGPQTPALSGRTLRLPRRWLVGVGVSALLLVGVWPVVHRARVMHRVQGVRLQPWEREDPAEAILAWRAKVAPHGMTLEEKVRAYQHAEARKQHPRSEEDTALGRKPQSLLEDEAAQHLRERVHGPATAPKGQWARDGRWFLVMRRWDSHGKVWRDVRFVGRNHHFTTTEACEQEAAQQARVAAYPPTAHAREGERWTWQVMVSGKAAKGGEVWCAAEAPTQGPTVLDAACPDCR